MDPHPSSQYINASSCIARYARMSPYSHPEKFSAHVSSSSIKILSFSCPNILHICLFVLKCVVSVSLTSKVINQKLLTATAACGTMIVLFLDRMAARV